MNWKELRQKIIDKYQEQNDVEVHELIWIQRTLTPDTKIDWSFVDTVDYDIESIPRRKELIIDFKAKPLEVAGKCQNLLK